MDLDHYFMGVALQEARRAQEEGEVPVGAVVVCHGRIVGRGHNQVERLQDPTAHAEILALTAAARFLRSWRLGACTLYVTLEPCMMCTGAILLSRLREVVFATEDPQMGFLVSRHRVNELSWTGRPLLVRRGPGGDEAKGLLHAFFRKLR